MPEACDYEWHWCIKHGGIASPSDCYACMQVERDALKAELAALRAGPRTGSDWVSIYDERSALKAQVERLTLTLKCNASDYGTHRCVRCDSEVEP